MRTWHKEKEPWERDSTSATCLLANEQIYTTIRGTGHEVTEAKLSWIGKWPAARLCVCRDATDAGAEAAIANLNGKDFQGRTLTVNEARERSAAAAVSWRLCAAAAVAWSAAAWSWRGGGGRGDAGRPSVKPFNKSAAEKRKKEISRQQCRRKRLNVCSSASKSEEARRSRAGEDPDIAGLCPALSLRRART